MFTTHKQAEIPIGLLFGGGSTQHWQYVEQTLHCPWFYVCLVRQLGEDTMHSMILIPSVLAFEKLLGEQEENLWIREVYLVAPGYMSESGHWEMSKIVGLFEVSGAGWDNCSYVYQLEDKRLYVDGDRESINLLSISRVIFSAGQHLRQ